MYLSNAVKKQRVGPGRSPGRQQAELCNGIMAGGCLSDLDPLVNQ